MDLGLKDKVALVTGGSRGVGRAIARALLLEGAKVMITARDPQRLAATAAELAHDPGGEVRAAAADLEDDDAVRMMVETTIRELGHFDILVNAAGSVNPADFASLTEAAWPAVFEQKLNGYVRCLRYAIPHLKTRGWGRIINLAGVGGREAGALTIPVGLNNAAVLNLTKSIALLMAPYNVLANAVVPHIIDTDRQDETMSLLSALSGKPEAAIRKERLEKLPLKRMGRADEVASVVAFLASERSSFVVGAAWHVDGGAYHGI
ncbi:MAG: SDR family oxidoreductase [Betaproteobacteria bacterium]|nr:MAG: SDR family oxidoreductase [Betaproteobacteria bacterium]